MGAAIDSLDMSHVCATGRRTLVRQASVLDGLAPGEAGLEVVPEGNVVALADLPAEIDLAPAQHGAEVDEPAVGILHLDAELGDLAQERLDLAGDRIGRAAAIRRDAPLQIFEERTNL